MGVPWSDWITRVRRIYQGFTLRTKFALHIVLSVLLLFALLIPIVLSLEERPMDVARRKGLPLAKVFAHSSVQGVIEKDFLLLRHVVNSLASERNVVAYAMVLDPAGRVLSHTDIREQGKVYTDSFSTRAIQAETFLDEGAAGQDSLFDFSYPIFVLNQRRATAIVRISIKEELAQIRRTHTTFLVTGLVVLGLGVVWASYQAGLVTRPVSQLLVGAQDVARGHLDRTIPVSSGDELGALARAFNEMATSLKRAQEDLVRSARLAAVGELAAAVAHEVRNPLAAVMSAVQSLRRSLPLTGDDAELLEIIGKECERLSAIVSDFLTFGRPHPPECQEVDLRDLIRSTLAILEQDGRFAPEQITVTVRAAPDLPPAWVDPNQITQALWNLFLNAIQAMGGKGELVVELTREGEDLVISLQDSGPGMPPEILAKVMEPFFTTKEDGSGLGLPIVRRIVEEHGGTVHITSAVGEGTRVTFSFPCAPRTVYA